MPSAEAIEKARDRLRTDWPFWAKHCAMILNESRQPVRLDARPWQLEVDAAMEKQRAEGRPVRILLGKARKLGFSTQVQSKFMQRVSQFRFQYALTVAQDNKTAGVLMDMARLMYERLPTEQQLGLGFNIRPQVIGQGQTRSGSRWMSFGDKMRPTEASIYETMTAGARASGRGYTPSMVHGSEVAHWDDPMFLLGLLNAVPKVEDTFIVLESTANGFNHWFERWERAVAGAEDPDTGGTYVPLFFGWHRNPFNSMAFSTDQARERFERTVGDPAGGGDDEEPGLMERFGVTLEQLRWRRVTRDEECEGKLELLHQEHPATPEEMFIGSGQPVFSGVLISRMIGEAQKATEPVQGVLRGADWQVKELRGKTVRVPQRALWVPESDITKEDVETWGSHGRLLVWEHPLNDVTQAELAPDKRQAEGRYVAFADVAQGEGTQEEGDYTAVQVIDHITRMQVARYRSRLPVHDLPLVLVLIGTYWNTAQLAIEVNNMGVGVVESVARDYRYRLMYKRHRPGDDQRTDGSEFVLGWMTTQRSKPLMEQTFGQALKAGEHGLRDVPTGREFTTYVEDPKNRAKHGAQKGAFDDLAVSFMGAHRVASELQPLPPRGSGPGRVRGWRPTDPITGG